MRPLFLLFLVFSGTVSRAALAPADTLHPISPARWVRYTYANDLFFHTDYYFTQGMTLTLVHPLLAHLPVRHLLAAGPRGSTQQHGITLRYDGFTPLRIQDAFIRVGDRPYAAYLYGSFFRISIQPARQQRLTTAFELGFVGPAAGGKALQTAIHRVTGNAEPRGWDYQIRNAPIVGYRVTVEQQLTAGQHAELLGQAEASLGTLYTYASAGLHLRVGRFSSTFILPDQPGGSPRWQLYEEANLTGRLIGYDATLQGTVFSDDPYKLPASAVRRAVLRGTGGLVLSHGKLSFAATATWVSPEFMGARSHRWGQLDATVRF